MPDADLIVLPCIGSQDHTTLAPARFTARMSLRQLLGHLVGAEARDQRQPARHVLAD